MNSESGGESITFSCECGQKIKVPIERTGAKGRCKGCGRTIVVPPQESDQQPVFSPPAHPYVPPARRSESERTYSMEDHVTYPDQLAARKYEPPMDLLKEKESLFGLLGHILKYPVSDKLAVQIFMTGAILFSPLVWKAMTPGHYLPYIGTIINLFILIIILSIRLMYFSYMLNIIRKSAEGIRRIPELPIFQTWAQNLKDLIKVLAASVVAFSPYLVYAASANIQLMAKMWEARARGEPLGAEAMAGASSSLGMLVLLYSITALYMPMVLMTLVVTKSFAKAINPGFIFRSISRIGREYIVAMLIIFVFLRGSLTILTILGDILAFKWFRSFAGYIGEPLLEFYVFVVTMHVIGLLYYRNGDKLQW